MAHVETLAASAPTPVLSTHWSLDCRHCDTDQPLADQCPALNRRSASASRSNMSHRGRCDLSQRDVLPQPQILRDTLTSVLKQLATAGQFRSGMN